MKKLYMEKETINILKDLADFMKDKTKYSVPYMCIKNIATFEVGFDSYEDLNFLTKREEVDLVYDFCISVLENQEFENDYPQTATSSYLLVIKPTLQNIKDEVETTFHIE